MKIDAAAEGGSAGEAEKSSCSQKAYSLRRACAGERLARGEKSLITHKFILNAKTMDKQPRMVYNIKKYIRSE
jgi:hypothetical protein